MADNDRIQSKGREANDAQPLNASDNQGGPERYPPARKDDAVEPRSFDGANPEPRQGAGDGGAPSVNEGRLGRGADPAEGKR